MISIKSEKEIEKIRKSCEIAVGAFAVAESMMKPGMRTIDIDRAVDDYIRSRGARSAFKGYNGYPASTCISIDDQVVHGIQGSRRLEEGQIVSVDVGVELDGYYGDAAKTFPVGVISAEKQRLLQVTREALYRGLSAAREGNRLSDISHAIQQWVEAAGFSVVRELVGHGVGRKLHEEPQVPNFGEPHRGPRLRAGMVLAIEPMVNMGRHEVNTAEDHWTVHTRDGFPSAHFEHTVLITKGEPEILTIGL